MAATEGFGSRTISRMIGWLGIPRVVTLPIFLALSTGGAQLAWHFIDSVKVLAWVSGMASPFCMLCATVVWAMRERIDDSVDTELMSSLEYQRFEKLTSAHRWRSTAWAGGTAVLALVASMPAVSNQLIGPIWHWMVLASWAAVGGATYAYVLANHWDVQIRAYKSRQKLAQKQRDERDRLMQAMLAGAGTQHDRGWVDGPVLSTSRSLNH